MVRAAVVLAILLAFGASAAAETSSPVFVEDLLDLDPVVVPGTEPVNLTWRLLNLQDDARVFVVVSLPQVRGWSAEIGENKFFLEPREERRLDVRLAPGPRVPERVEFTTTFTFHSSKTGESSVVSREVRLVATEAVLVLGLFENPLGPPLDNVYGVFALDIAFWTALAAAAMVTGGSVVRVLAARAPSETVRSMIRKLRKPVFSLVLLVGLRESFAVLPESAPAEALSIALDLLVILAAAVVGYKVVSALLEYYAATFATRTETKLDDVLVPVLRKIVAVAVTVVALVLALDLFGLNANVLFGAAGIAGLVIAFAAQDTLSNFFAGVFLLLDRPFVEGDDVQIETGEIARVEVVGLRTTRLYHYRNHEMIILPNNQLASRRVVNLSTPDRHYRVRVDIGVAYGSDARRVMALLEDLARTHPNVITDDPRFAPSVRFDGFGDSSMNFYVQLFVREGGGTDRLRSLVPTEMRARIVEAFAREGIEIPFPHRTVILKDGARPGAAAPDR